jgi:hypothetical protein
MKVKVISIFRDMFTDKLYKVGEILEIENEDRIEDLNTRGLAELIESEKPKTITVFEKEFGKKVVVEALKAIGEKATMNMKEETLLSTITALDEEKVLALKESLEV